MNEIIPPVDPAEELRKQWKNEVMSKINKMNSRSKKEFQEELEDAKRKVNEEAKKQINGLTLDKLNYTNILSRYHNIVGNK